MTGTGLPDEAVRRLRAQLALPPLVAGRYAPRGLIGRGGMGEVHRATDERLGREVALKVLAADAASGTLAERLRRESRVLARLEHPGIVPVHDAGVLEDGRAWYVMRFVEGARLDDHARGGVGRGELLRIVLRIAETVAFAHGRGIIHRDLKPGNVMIGPFGEVLVLDWGVAKVLGDDVPPERPGNAGQGPRAHRDDDDPLTLDGTAVGTPGYMPPEQAQGLAVDQRADVHALGVILRELLAMGTAPVPKPLLSIVARATAPEAVRRYPTVAELSADVRRWLDGEAVLAHREGLAERLWRFVRRHQAAILLLVAYVLIRTVILLWRGI